MSHEKSPQEGEPVNRLSQNIMLRRELRKELSPQTPVLDAIDGLSAFANEAARLVREGHPVDLFIIGRSGDGKSAISEQIIQSQSKTERPVRRRYYNTSMAVQEAREKGLITSPSGSFTKEEYEVLSEKIIRSKLEDTAQQLSQLRLLEFPAVEEGFNVGNSALVYGRERARSDSGYIRRAIGVIAERMLHRRNKRMRKEIWQATTSEELQRIFKKYNIVPNPPMLHPFEMRERMGTPQAMERIDKDVERQVLNRQAEIRLRGIDKSLPILTEKLLRQDEALEERALSDLYKLRLGDVGIKEEDMFIAINKRIRRKIPYYGTIRNDPDLRL